MADPDATKLGYLKQHKVGNKTVYSNKKSTGGTYAPSPTQAPVAYQAYQASQSAKKETQKARQMEKAANNPRGDVDNDGIPNAVDGNNLRKKTINPERKQLSSETKAQAERREYLNTKIQAQLDKAKPELGEWDVVTLAGPSPGDYHHTFAVSKDDDRIWYVRKTVETAQGPRDKWVFSHVQVDGKNYTEKIQNPELYKNPNYKKRLDADNNGVSGTKKDYKVLVKNKLEDKKEKKSSEEGDGPNTDVTTDIYSKNPQHFNNKQKNISKRQGKTKDQRIAGGGDGFAKEMDVNTLMMKSSGNGDKLYRIFQKAYGDQASTNFNQTIENIKANPEVVVKEIGKPGQYGYTVAIKTKNGWTTDVNEVKNHLVKYVPAGTDSSSSQVVEQLKLAGTASGGLESSLSKRFGRAYYAGDDQKGNQSLMAAFNAYKAKNPGKIRFVGAPGETGSYIQVKINGQWVSSSDKVAKELSGFVKNAATNKPIIANKQQKDLLMGANGNAVLNNFINKYGDAGIAQKNLKIAMTAYEKSNPGNDIRYFGNIGQPGFYIEVKTQNGWVNGTQAVLNRLDKYMPKPVVSQPSNSPAAGVSADSAFAPGATGPNQSAPADSTTGSLPSEQANSQNPTTNSEDPTGPGVVGTGETVGPEIGLEAGSQEFNQFDDRLRQWAGDRQQEKDSFNPNNSKNGAVDLGKAARKSEAMMAFDLDGNGEISAAEKSLMANGDQNNNGVVGEYGLKKFVAQADTNNSGLVSQAEVKAYNVVDTNNNNKLGTREIKAYGNVDTNNDGSITKKEAKEVVKDLRAQVDLSKQEKKDLDLAKQYLAKSNGKGGGAESVDQQVAALVNSQPKHEKQGDNGPKGAQKKNKN